jgi:hypothetical protein
MYFETFKTVITAAGLAIPVIGATVKNGPVDNLGVLKRAALCLLLEVALSIITLLEMSRHCEKFAREISQLWKERSQGTRKPSPRKSKAAHQATTPRP